MDLSSSSPSSASGSMVMKSSMLFFFLFGFTTTSGFITPSAFISTTKAHTTSHVQTTATTATTATTTTTTQLYETSSKNAAESQSTSSQTTQKRSLGSQELLMLPRQYKIHLDKNGDPFPQMSHVSAITLSETPSIQTLSKAIDEAMEAHPLLRCHIEGDGEPTKRIDAFQMVREGEPNPCTFVCPTLQESKLSSEDVLSVVEVEGGNVEDLESSWNTNFAYNLDSGADWCDVFNGPLWKVELHRLKGATAGKDNTPCAMVFTFNHAISDQSSVNMLIDHIVSNMASIEASSSGVVTDKALKQKIPISMEESVLGMNNSFSDVQTDGFSLNTASYIAGKAAEGFRDPVILPDNSKESEGNGLLGALTIISGKAPGGESEEERKSTVQFRTLPQSTVDALLKKCKENGVTMSNVLSAAIAFTSSDFIDGGNDDANKERNYKVLQSLDMRRFGSGLDNCDSVACMAGSHDLMLGPLPDKSGDRLRQAPTMDLQRQFWDLVKESKQQTLDFIESEGPQEATRVFDFAMTISDMNNLVYLSAQSKESLGRAYSAGIVNAGVFERQKAVQRESDADTSRKSLVAQHGRFKVEEIYFATSHARSGCLYQASCLTVNNELKCTFHPADPIVNSETNSRFADAFVELLETISSESDSTSTVGDTNMQPILSQLKNAPTLAAAAFGLIGVGMHTNGWLNFFSSLAEMKESVADPSDFWAALNFWIFFAVGHPILQPILWISDVLHGTPGPMVGNLVPALFILGNIVAILVISSFKEVGNAVNIFALSAFLTYVGAGLDGQAGLGDFNLALDDKYNGAVVKGCPTYDQVRQPSMNNFDITKYEGFWYEQKFHDWTQFKEVYDTTLDIKVRKGVHINRLIEGFIYNSFLISIVSLLIS
jgi:hypothetical protein